MSASSQELQPDAERVRTEASVWLAALRSSARAPEMEARFHSWLEESPAHHKAFYSVTRAWELLGSAGEQLRSDRRRQKIQRRRMVGTIAACLVLSIGLGVWFAATPSQVFETERGEQQTVVLKDGSRLMLNTDTRAVVRYMPYRRSIRLEHGEAAFDVAHDKSRPFVVSADGEDITAVGTSFVVRSLSAGQLGVTLTEGRLKLTPAESRGKSAPIFMTAGQRWTVGAGVEKLALRDMQEIAAWRRGEVIFNDTSLAAAVAEMNRYSAKQVYLDISQTDDLKISGIFRFDDGDAFARTLAALYGLTIEERDNELHLLGRVEQKGSGTLQEAASGRRQSASVR